MIEENAEVVRRFGNTSYFLYKDPTDNVIKVCVYRRYTRILQVSVLMDSRSVRCFSTNLVRYDDLYEVERLLRGILPQQVLLLEILQKAILSQDGLVEVKFEDAAE